MYLDSNFIGIIPNGINDNKTPLSKVMAWQQIGADQDVSSPMSSLDCSEIPSDSPRATTQ